MHAELSVSHLRCEYLVDPQGIDERSPRLSWQIESARRGARQRAYRVLVARTREKLAEAEGDFWDSGYIESDQTVHIVYAGSPLVSRQVCYWAVQVWDETGAAAASASACWTMGLLERADWHSRWITADPEIIYRDRQALVGTHTQSGSPAHFRREFNVPGPVRRAVLYASARGLIQVQANRQRVSPDLFSPEWTDYQKRIHYRSYDVTALIEPGPNRLDAILGDGWWSGFVGWQETRVRYGSVENSLVLQLEIELASGAQMTVGTDRSWHCATGPILSSDLLMGEVYDARRAPSDWLPAVEVAAPSVPLVAQRSEPIRITEELDSLAVNEVSPGVFLYNFGQNVTGWARLRVRAVAGTRVQLRHGERVNADGSLHTDNLRRARATDVYICRGEGEEAWEPHFTFHGFQFVEVTGLPPGQPANALTACVVHSTAPAAGFFSCSNPDVNRLWLNGLWSQRGNFLSVPMDSPQRDDRLGWTGGAQVFLRTAAYNMDVAGFYSKWMTDIADAQTRDGVFPDVAPRLPEETNYTGLDRLEGSPGWADAGVIVPWSLWRIYGDLRIVERHWPAMTAWLDWLERTNPSGLRVNGLGNNYGDWLCFPADTTIRTPSPMKFLLATAYWADGAAKMATMAHALGRRAEAERFTAMFENVRAAFQREFLREDGRLAVETQTAYVLALAFDLLPENVRARSAARLVANISELGWHFSGGLIGLSQLAPVLCAHGQADAAYRLLLREEFPSWLFPVKQGATTGWERWNGWTQGGGFSRSPLNSFNNCSLGSVGEWLFRHVAGIDLDPDVPGFKQFVLRPYVTNALTQAQATYRTLHGEIASHWEKKGEEFIWHVTIPANTRAEIWIPSAPLANVTENGQPLPRSPGIRVIGREKNCVVCEAAAGSYAFVSALSVVNKAPPPKPKLTLAPFRMDQLARTSEAIF